MKEGDAVELRPGVNHRCPKGRDNNTTARIKALLGDGGVYLERDLRGCRWWNREDVVTVRDTTAGKHAAHTA